MATPPVLDFDTLLAPIPGDSPAGGPVPFELRQELDEARKEIDPEDFRDDPTPPEAKKADWPGAVRVAQDILTTHSKNLDTAARLTEALTRRYGFAGFRDGLTLMRRMVEECWDRLYPVIESADDVESRAAPFFWLDEADRGARFPTTLRQVPLISNKVRGEPPFADVIGYCQLDIQPDSKNNIKVPTDEFAKMLLNTPVVYVQTVAEDFAACMEEVQRFLRDAAPRFESAAPGLTGIRQALSAIKPTVEDNQRKRGGGEQPAEEAPANGEAATGGVVATGTGRAAVTRDDAYRQLANAANVLKQLEPHSPIPYLVERAVELGRLPFPMLIRELVRDAAVLSSLNRELGIKEGSEDAGMTSS